MSRSYRDTKKAKVEAVVRKGRAKCELWSERDLAQAMDSPEGEVTLALYKVYRHRNSKSRKSIVRLFNKADRKRGKRLASRQAWDNMASSTAKGDRRRPDWLI